MPATPKLTRRHKARTMVFRPELEPLGERVLPAQQPLTWRVQSAYFGTGDGVSQARSLRSLALSGDEQDVYTGFIQGNTGAAIRRVSSDVLAVTGSDTVVFGNESTPFGSNPPYTGDSSTRFARVATTGFPHGLATDDRGYVYAVNTSDTDSFAQEWSIYGADLGTTSATAMSSNATASVLRGIDVVNVGGTYYAYVGWRNGLLERWVVTDPADPALDTSWGAVATPGKVDLKAIDADAYVNNLSIDADGTVFVAGGLQSTTTFGDALIKIPAAGAAAGDLSGATSVNVPGAMDVALFSGQAYVAQFRGADATVSVFFTFDLSSDGIIPVPDFGTSRFNGNVVTDYGISGIDISADGRIFLADQTYLLIPSTGSYTPPATSFNPTPIAITGTRVYFDRVVASSALNVVLSPLVTSGDSTTFVEGTAGTFTVTSSGSPTAGLSASGLPAGVTFTDNGDGTATIAGTPTQNGVYSFTITAANGAPPNATQTFTLTVNEVPAVTSANSATFAFGAADSFTVTASGFPTPDVDFQGALPVGVTFTDNGDGTATIAGTPTESGSFALTLSATNRVGSSTAQAFTLTVNRAPAITSANSTSLVVGTAGTFTVTTTGTPSPAVSILTGALPAGVTFTDNGDGTATIAGSPTATGLFSFTLTAANGVVPAPTQTFTLTVNQVPTFTRTTLPPGATAAAPYSAAVAVGGFPAPTFAVADGTLPPGMTLDATTGALTGTPGAAGSFTFTVRASNAAGATSRAFSLAVAPVHLTAVGAVPGGGPRVTVRNPDGTVRLDFFAYDSSARLGVRVSTGDVTGDGVDDIITGAGAGGAPHVKVFDGRTGAEVASFFAFDSALRGGVSVGVADPDGDGAVDVVAGAGAGGAPHVRAFRFNGLVEVASFFAFDSNFRGGVNAASGDLTGDGRPELVLGAGAGGGPVVWVYDGSTAARVSQFLAGPAADRGGVRVAVADPDGDGANELVTRVTGTTRVLDPLSGADRTSDIAADLLSGVFVG